jgi:hypothetical protein
MTLVLELNPETARRIAEKAAAQHVASEEIAIQVLEAAFAEENDGDSKFDAALNGVFSKYHHAFEGLAEGAK